MKLRIRVTKKYWQALQYFCNLQIFKPVTENVLLQLKNMIHHTKSCGGSYDQITDKGIFEVENQTYALIRFKKATRYGHT